MSRFTLVDTIVTTHFEKITHFSKCVKFGTSLTHFEKKISKCVKFGTSFTHFEKFQTALKCSMLTHFEKKIWTPLPPPPQKNELELQYGKSNIFNTGVSSGSRISEKGGPGFFFVFLFCFFFFFFCYLTRERGGGGGGTKRCLVDFSRLLISPLASMDVRQGGGVPNKKGGVLVIINFYVTVCASKFLHFQQSVWILWNVRRGSAPPPRNIWVKLFHFAQKYTIWHLQNCH